MLHKAVGILCKVIIILMLTRRRAKHVTGSYTMIWVRLALQRLYLFFYFILDVCVSYVLRLAVCMSLHFVASSSDNLA